MFAWSVKPRRARSRHCRDATVYGHTTTAMHDEYTPPRRQPGGGSGGAKVEMGVIRKRYDGKAKGRKQVLCERGWFVDGRPTAATVAPEMNIDTVLGNLPNLKSERQELQHLAESRGHILLLSPNSTRSWRGWGSSTPRQCPSNKIGGRSTTRSRSICTKTCRTDVHGIDTDGPAHAPLCPAQARLLPGIPST